MTFEALNDGDVTIAPIVPSGDTNSAGLTITSQGNVTTSGISLDGNTGTDGTLVINIDTNFSPTGTALTLGGLVQNVADVQIAGTGSNDTVNVNGNITSGGGITIQTINNVNISAALLQADGGNLDVENSVNTVTLLGGGSVTLDLNSAPHDVVLPALNSASTNLIVTSDGGISLQGAIGANANQVELTTADPLTLTQNISAGTLEITGGTNSTVTQSGGSITVTNLLLNGSGTTNTLSQATNDVDNLAANTGSLTFRDTDDLNVSSVLGVNGITVSNNDVSLTASTLTITNLIDSSAANHDVTLNVTANVIDGNGTGLDVNAGAGKLTIDAVTGVGTVANPLETTVGTIDIDNTTSGEVGISGTANLDVTRVVQGTEGNILLNATNDITMSNSSVVDGGNTGSSGGEITLTAGGNVTLGSVQTGDTGASAVTITATAGGVKDGGNSNIDIVADSGTVNITSALGVEAIETSAGTLNVTNTGAGAITINESSDVTITNVHQQGTGAVVVDAVGNVSIASSGTGVQNDQAAAAGTIKD